MSDHNNCKAPGFCLTEIIVKLIYLCYVIMSDHNNCKVNLLCGYWRFCVVYTDKVSVKPIRARYGGWLSE